jgi:hypothetical protein
MTPTASEAGAFRRVAKDELRLALASRQDGRRVTYAARKADQIVRAIHALHPAQAAVDVLGDAIRMLRRLLRDLPATAAGHVRRALHYAERALRIHEASLAAA